MKKEITIKSLADYIRRVTNLKPRETEGSLFHKEIVFRGLSNCEYELVPSLDRYPSGRWMNSLAFVERDLISEAIQKYPSSFSQGDLPLAKLAKLQHFGIPTRMMDVTSSALVALYFACQESNRNRKADGEIIVFSDYPTLAINANANIVADTYRLTGNAFTPLESYYYRAIKQDYAISLQYPNWEKEHGNAIQHFRQSLSRPFLVDSFEVSTRQKNQQGKFILFPNTIVDSEEDDTLFVTGDLIKLSKHDPLIIKRYIVPNELKEEILRSLSVLGISKEYLFADSVDTVFEAVKKHQESRYK